MPPPLPPPSQVSTNGSRMILKDLDPDAVERWVDMKKASVAGEWTCIVDKHNGSQRC